MNGVLAFLAPVNLRNRWRNYAGVALLLALTGGLALFAIAGGRRTQSAYPRFLRSVNASTLIVTSAGGYDPAVTARLASLPQVRMSRTYVAFNDYAFHDGKPDFAQQFEASGTFDGRFVDEDRFTPIAGRAANQSKTDEVVVNEYAAERNGYHVGDRLDLGLFAQPQIERADFFTGPPPPVLITKATIVGIGVLPDEVLQDDEDRTPRVLLTKAYTNREGTQATYSAQGLVLRHGDAGIPAVERRVAQLVPSGTVEFRVTSVDEFHARQAVRPLAIALELFGVVIGIAGLVLVAQALARAIRIDRTDREKLRALGADPRTILANALAVPALAILLGTFLAAVLAIAASPTMPIGPVRRVEVSSGFDLDLATILGGCVIIVVVLVAFVTALAWFESPHRLARAGRRAPRAPRVVTAAASSGLAPSAVAGLRFAFESPSRTNATPTRSVILGTTIALSALVSASTFGASLHTLVERPHLYGWNWNAAVIAGDGYDNMRPEGIKRVLAADAHIASWSGAYFGHADIAGNDVPLLGMAPRSAVAPPILDGREIVRADEVVLGAATARALHKSIGDTVTLARASTAHRLTVVGIATLPTIGRLHAAHTSLGVGAIVAPRALPGIDRNILGQKKTGLGPSVVFVRYRPGTDAASELARLRKEVQPIGGFAGIDALNVQRPAEIVNSSSIGSAPVVLAIALLLGAMLSLGLALAASVRRSRRDLVVLKMLGFTQRQLGATVTWQATATVLVGLLVGVPLGILAGRELWDRFAHALNVVAQPQTPLGALVGIAFGALVVANIVAAVPARNARRVGAARLLHVE